MKKITSMLMALVLALTLLPSAVWAEGDDQSSAAGNTPSSTANTIDLATFIQKVRDANYNYDGQGITVAWSPVSGCFEIATNGGSGGTHKLGGDCPEVAATGNTPNRTNDNYAQFQLFKDKNESVTIKNVNFIYTPETFDVCGNTEWKCQKSTLIPAELQFENISNTTLIGCTFDKVGLSLWNNSQTVTQVVKDCTFKNVKVEFFKELNKNAGITISEDAEFGDYAIHYLRAGNIYVSGNTFENVTRGMLVYALNSQKCYVVNNDFSGVADNEAMIKVNDTKTETRLVVFGNTDTNGRGTVCRMINNINIYTGTADTIAYTDNSQYKNQSKAEIKGVAVDDNGIVTELKAYTVTVNPLNGENTTTETVLQGETLKIDDPTRAGYTFDGWYNGETKWTGGSAVTSNLTLIAHWTKNVDAGTTTNTTVTVDENGTITETVTNETGTAKSEVVTTTTVDEEGKVSVTEVKTATDSTNNVTTTTKVENGVAEVTAKVENSEAVKADAKTVNLDATTAGNTVVETTKVTLAAADATKINAAAKAGTVETVAIKTDVGTLTINSTALKTITDKVTDSHSLELVVKKTDEGTTSTQTTTTTTATYVLTALVNGQPVFEETNKDSNGTITITVPWTSAPGFRQQIVCYYVDGNTRTRMGGAGYKNNTFSWDTNHFSKFEVVSETVSNSRASINISGSSTGTTATTTTTTGKASSATTFDAGVGIYAVSAILSVTGMAWVGKKKH